MIDYLYIALLKKDIALQNTARKRAKELIKRFDHVRPDGSLCFEIYPAGLYGAGENIAFGAGTCAQVTELWKETNYKYAGQGHRRNMLEEGFDSVGIAGYQKSP